MRYLHRFIRLTGFKYPKRGRGALQKLQREIIAARRRASAAAAAQAALRGFAAPVSRFPA
jgi:hypothetical protein